MSSAPFTPKVSRFAGRRSVKYRDDTNLLLHVQIIQRLPLDPALQIRKRDVATRASEMGLSDLARKSERAGGRAGNQMRERHFLDGERQAWELICSAASDRSPFNQRVIRLAKFVTGRGRKLPDLGPRK
jgi:hypothetical protein